MVAGLAGAPRQSPATGQAQRVASPRFQMANPQSLLPPGAGQAQRVASRRGGELPIPSPTGRRCPKGADEGMGRSRMPCLESMPRLPACPPLSFISHIRVGFAPVPSPQPLSQRERGSSTHLGLFKISRSWTQRAEASAWPGIGGERHTDVPRGESDRMSDRAEEPIPGRAGAHYRSQSRQASCFARPHPQPRSAPRQEMG